MDPFGLPQNTITKIQAVFSEYPQIEKALIYGSRAKGDYRKGSDIDISFFGEGLNLDIIFAVEEKIDELYLPYTFDLSIFENINSLPLKDHIKRVGKVFYDKSY